MLVGDTVPAAEKVDDPFRHFLLCITNRKLIGNRSRLASPLWSLVLGWQGGQQVR